MQTDGTETEMRKTVSYDSADAIEPRGGDGDWWIEFEKNSCGRSVLGRSRAMECVINVSENYFQ
jgi:hypothetical protein